MLLLLRLLAVVEVLVLPLAQLPEGAEAPVAVVDGVLVLAGRERLVKETTVGLEGQTLPAVVVGQALWAVMRAQTQVMEEQGLRLLLPELR